jgi:hypothetical protein
MEQAKQHDHDQCRSVGERRSPQVTMSGRLLEPHRSATAPCWPSKSTASPSTRTTPPSSRVTPSRTRYSPRAGCRCCGCQPPAAVRRSGSDVRSTTPRPCRSPHPRRDLRTTIRCYTEPSRWAKCRSTVVVLVSCSSTSEPGVAAGFRSRSRASPGSSWATTGISREPEVADLLERTAPKPTASAACPQSELHGRLELPDQPVRELAATWPSESACRP